MIIAKGCRLIWFTPFFSFKIAIKDNIEIEVMYVLYAKNGITLRRYNKIQMKSEF